MNFSTNEIKPNARLHWHSLPEALEASPVKMLPHAISASLPTEVRTFLLIERMAQARGTYEPVQIPGIAANWLSVRERWILVHNRTTN